MTITTVDWHDPEMRHAYEFYLALSILLTLAMIIGGVVYW